MGLEIVKSTYFRSCTIGKFSCFISLSNVLKFAFKVGFERNQILVICSSTCVQRCSLSPHRILTYSLLAAQTPAPRGNLQIYYTACLIKIILSLAHTVQKHNFRSTRDSRVKRLGTHDNNIHDDNDNPLENTPHLPYDHPQNGDSGSDVKYCFPSKFFDDQATHLSSSFCNFGHHWILMVSIINLLSSALTDLSFGIINRFSPGKWWWCQRCLRRRQMKGTLASLKLAPTWKLTCWLGLKKAKKSGRQAHTFNLTQVEKGWERANIFTLQGHIKSQRRKEGRWARTGKDWSKVLN